MTAQTPRLDGRVVVVVGGSGVVGGTVVRALRAAGARVVVPTRGRAGDGDDDGVRPVHVDSWDAPHEILAVAAEPGWGPDAVVAAVGGWWLGPPVVELAVGTWRDLVESHLTAHFLAARSLAPLVAGRPGAAYVMLNGAASREPMVGSGPVCVAGAGQHMLLEMLRSEEIGTRVRFHEVLVLAAVAGDDRNLAPTSEVGGGEVAAAVLATLADPTSPAVVTVGAAG
ncbi:MAG: hypothetical protein HGA44_01770 [Cellulomonadaceae bacterium]|nr:hypothetical protein [Cellulomonadaceae bacterium]